MATTTIVVNKATVLSTDGSTPKDPASGGGGDMVQQNAILLGRVTGPVKAVAATPHTVSDLDFITNEGAAEKIVHTLPTAAAGLEASFVVQDAFGLRVVAASGDTIRVLGNVSIAAGYIESTALGAVLILKAINATEWIAINCFGTWTLETV